MKVTATSYFFLFWVYNSITSYVPVLFKIYLYGNIVGNPDDGYAHLETIRFKHCHQYGCIDAVVYLLVAISFPYFFIPLVLIPLLKLLRNCCKKLKCGCCTSFWCYCCKKCKESSCCNKPQSKYSYTADKYVEFAVFYGYIIFFMTIAGIIPILIALVSLPLTTHLIATSYLDKNKKYQESYNNNGEQKKDNPSKELETGLYDHWKNVLLGMTLVSMFTNIAHVIPNSRFLQHVSYCTSTGYHHSTLDLQGYLDVALPNHSLFRLIEIGAFPNYNAHYLPEKYIGGNRKKDSDGKDILYLPFVDFDCLKEMNSSYDKDYFTRGSYINYIRDNEYNYIMEYNDKKQAIEPGPCFIDYQCRSRGIPRNTEQGKRLQTVRIKFCSVFALPFLIIGIVGIVDLARRNNTHTVLNWCYEAIRACIIDYITSYRQCSHCCSTDNPDQPLCTDYAALLDPSVKKLPYCNKKERLQQ